MQLLQIDNGIELGFVAHKSVLLRKIDPDAEKMTDVLKILERPQHTALNEGRPKRHCRFSVDFGYPERKLHAAHTP